MGWPAGERALVYPERASESWCWFTALTQRIHATLHRCTGRVHLCESSQGRASGFGLRSMHLRLASAHYIGVCVFFCIWRFGAQSISLVVM